MGAYMYAIHVDYEPKVLSFTETHRLTDGILTLAILEEYVGRNDTFSINEIEEVFGVRYELDVHKSRLETAEETAKRVAKEEAYNERYKEYHRKRKGA